MEIDYRILNLYKTRQYDECLKLCEIALEEKDDRMVEFVRMRAMTILAKVAGNGYEEVEYLPQQDTLTTTAVAKTPRPGTSFIKANTSRTAHGIASASKVGSNTSRTAHGIASASKVGSNTSRTAHGIASASKVGSNTSRTAHGIASASKVGSNTSRTAHGIASASKKKFTAAATARSRMGTSTACVQRSARSALHTAARVSRAATAVAGGAAFNPAVPLSLRFLTKEDNMFAPAANTLFEYVFYCEGDVRKAMEIAFQAQKIDENPDWWWLFSLARCYYALGMNRNSEDCLRQALKQNKHISIYLRLVAMYVGINQPLSALEICKQGLSVFHEYTPLLLEQARIHDQMGNSALAVKEYRTVALEDPSNMEAIASIALYNFYNDQPEIALRYYRRLLATNVPGPEIYNNLALCCLYCNQWDLILPCFRQALYFSTDPDTKSNIWFNLAHVALSTGDMSLAKRCLQVSIAVSSDNEGARNALRALEGRLRARKT